MGYLENIQAQARKGVLEFVILLIIEKGEVYSSDILKQLASSKLIVVEGTLYPLLTRLRNHELVEYKWKESKSGPPRKYYILTVKGVEALKDLKKCWGDLSTAIQLLIKNNGKGN